MLQSDDYPFDCMFVVPNKHTYTFDQYAVRNHTGWIVLFHPTSEQVRRRNMSFAHVYRWWHGIFNQRGFLDCICITFHYLFMSLWIPCPLPWRARVCIFFFSLARDAPQFFVVVNSIVAHASMSVSALVNGSTSTYLEKCNAGASSSFHSKQIYGIRCPGLNVLYLRGRSLVCCMIVVVVDLHYNIVCRLDLDSM